MDTIQKLQCVTNIYLRTCTYGRAQTDSLQMWRAPDMQIQAWFQARDIIGKWLLTVGKCLGLVVFSADQF